jgi:hypothetical protein
MVDEINPVDKIEEFAKKKKLNSWKVTSFVLGILLIVSLWNSGIPGLAVGSGDVEEKALDFVNNVLLQGQATAISEGITQESGVYKVNLNVMGQESPVYVSKDGTLLFLQAVPLEDLPEISDSGNDNGGVVQAAVPKTDKPVVELFIMSHCPYGTQSEKGMLPVAYLFGDKIDFQLKFVYYAMHPDSGEVEEQLNQYCIMEEQEDKFLDYLQCFLEDADGERCLSEIEIDITMLETCTATADEEFSITANLEDTDSWLSGNYPMFDIHKADNEKYSIGGSPSLVVNGVEVERAPRDSVGLRDIICDAFNVAPEECNTELDSTSPGPGFGWSTTGSDNVASCGG